MLTRAVGLRDLPGQRSWMRSALGSHLLELIGNGSQASVVSVNKEAKANVEIERPSILTDNAHDGADCTAATASAAAKTHNLGDATPVASATSPCLSRGGKWGIEATSAFFTILCPKRFWKIDLLCKLARNDSPMRKFKIRSRQQTPNWTKQHRQCSHVRISVYMLACQYIS